MPRLDCIVNTCVHWAPTNACSASRIQVGGERAERQRQSYCQTFGERFDLIEMVTAMGDTNWLGAATAILGDGQQLNPRIDCDVSLCHYWHEGNECTASSIVISGKNAHIPESTACESFRT